MLDLHTSLVPILVDVLDTASVEGRGTANDAMNLITLLQEKLGEVGTILTGNTCRRARKASERTDACSSTLERDTSDVRM